MVMHSTRMALVVVLAALSGVQTSGTGVAQGLARGGPMDPSFFDEDVSGPDMVAHSPLATTMRRSEAVKPALVAMQQDQTKKRLPEQHDVNLAQLLHRSSKPQQHRRHPILLAAMRRGSQLKESATAAGDNGPKNDPSPSAPSADSSMSGAQSPPPKTVSVKLDSQRAASGKFAALQIGDADAKESASAAGDNGPKNDPSPSAPSADSSMSGAQSPPPKTVTVKLDSQKTASGKLAALQIGDADAQEGAAAAVDRGPENPPAPSAPSADSSMSEAQSPPPKTVSVKLDSQRAATGKMAALQLGDADAQESAAAAVDNGPKNPPAPSAPSADSSMSEAQSPPPKTVSVKLDSQRAATGKMAALQLGDADAQERVTTPSNGPGTSQSSSAVSASQSANEGQSSPPKTVSVKLESQRAASGKLAALDTGDADTQAGAKKHRKRTFLSERSHWLISLAAAGAQAAVEKVKPSWLQASSSSVESATNTAPAGGGSAFGGAGASARDSPPGASLLSTMARLAGLSSSGNMAGEETISVPPGSVGAVQLIERLQRNGLRRRTSEASRRLQMLQLKESVTGAGDNDPKTAPSPTPSADSPASQVQSPPPKTVTVKLESQRASHAGDDRGSARAVLLEAMRGQAPSAWHLRARAAMPDASAM